MLWCRRNFKKRSLSLIRFVFLHHTPQKNMKKSTFFPIFSIFSYGLIIIFTIFAITIYHNKMRKKSIQKKYKKKGFFFFNTLFYFSKMDKNKCPKLFLKKKFQKTGIFYFFHSYVFNKNYQNIPKNRNSCFEN